MLNVIVSDPRDKRRGQTYPSAVLVVYSWSFQLYSGGARVVVLVKWVHCLFGFDGGTDFFL